MKAADALARGMLASARARLMALLSVAAIPLVVMAGIAAWQNYQVSLDRVYQVVLLGREAETARHESALDGARQLLAAVSEATVVRDASNTQCTLFLSNVLALDNHRYAELAVVGPDGTARCASGEMSAGGSAFSAVADQSWFQAVRRSHDLVIGRLSQAGREPDVTIAYPIMDGGVFLGAVAAIWRLAPIRRSGTPAGEVDVWLSDPYGTLVPAGGTTDAALPAPDRLAALLADRRVTAQAPSRGGGIYTYASGPLSGGWHLLVGYDASGDFRAARALLLARFVEAIVLLLVGLVAVGVGVHVAVVEPLKRLTAAVGRWRGGGPFTPGNLAGVPTEVAELSRSFAEATGALAEREGQLRGALARQDLLMREVNHRVKNNLQIVASLLNLQASRIRQPQARAEFESARDRIRALATLHRHLYVHGELQWINMRGFLTELCGQLFQAMGETEGERIGLAIEATELELSSDQAVPLSLIVTEAVSNAVKYAFPGGRRGHVAVRLRTEGELAVLVVEDDGVGIPAGRMETEAGIRDGIGIQLIRGFARQLGARLTVEEGNGTRYTAEIPIRRDARASDQEASDAPDQGGNSGARDGPVTRPAGDGPFFSADRDVVQQSHRAQKGGRDETGA